MGMLNEYVCVPKDIGFQAKNQWHPWKGKEMEA